MSGETIVSGTLADRPWGQTLSLLAERKVTGQINVVAGDKTYAIALDLGAIIGATSPLASDALVRIAMQSQMISSTQVAEIARRIAAAPDRDEIEVLADAARLSPELVQRLRRRAILLRAARTFALERGELAIQDAFTIPVSLAIAVDVRAVVYLGARMHLHEQRLAADLRGLGSHFVLRREALETLSKYELTTAELPIIEALKTGTNLPELEATHREIDPRTAQAVVYALACCGACEMEHRPSIPRTATAARRDVDPDVVALGLAQPATPPATTTTGAASAPRPARPPAAGGGYSLRPDDPGEVVLPRTRTSPPAAPGLGGLRDELDAPTARGTPATPAPARPGRISSSPVVPRTKTGEPATARTSTASGPAVARTSTARRTQALVAARTLLVDQGADYFTLLGLPFDASPEVVRTSYLILAKQLHPDKIAELEQPEDQGAAQRLFAHMSTAFAVLTDPVRRQAYLEGIARGGPTPSVPRTKTGEATDTTPAAQAAQAVKRAELALKSDRPGEAVNELLRACELQPNNVDFAALLAWARFCAASDKVAVAGEARKPLERAILRSDKPEIARFHLGRLERIVGRDREALRHFQYVLEETPNHPEAAAEVRAIEARLAAASRR